MITSQEEKELLMREPRFGDIMCSLLSVPTLPHAIIKETRMAVALARKFNDEVVKPRSLELDLKLMEDPDYLPRDLVEEANRWGFFTLWEPKMFGGKGLCFPSLAPFCEELASVCLGIANMVAVHYLGVATLISTWNIRLINKLLREATKGEKTGVPCIMSMGITEPNAGSDVVDVDLLNKSNAVFRAEKVEGGYLLNGMKHFISNGHYSTWFIVFGYEDLKKAGDSIVVLAVKAGSKGFSLGRMERKMGQKACPASELVFEDCFVPDEYVCFSPKQARTLKQSVRKSNQQLVDTLSAASRPGVGSFGTGVARGAYEAALKFASETEIAGKLLVNHEWAQCLLAEMYKNVVLARLAYVEGNYANGLYGTYKLLQMKPIFYLTKCTPRFVFDAFVSPLMNLSIITWLFRKINFDWWKEEYKQLTTGLTAVAKIACTDLGIKNCQLALEMMGRAGLRHDARVEKHLRDSKLLQIYEGTNQLCRLNLFKSMIARSVPGVTMFEE
jgi:alkylation response protein AidB-like acyl-CoA dehydrogenase